MFTYERIQSFNDTEMEIYHYLMDNKDYIPYLSIRKLAEAVHVSTSSIIRFCEKCECEGYNDFKESFKRYIHRLQPTQPSIDIKNITDYFENIDKDLFSKKIEECVEVVHKSKQVIFLGEGSSGIIAKYGAWVFSSHGVFSVAIDNMYHPVTKTMKDTLIIALSIRGESARVIDAIHRFKRHDAKVITLTNLPNSTIAKLGDWNMNYFGKEESEKGDIVDLSSQLPALFVLESIARQL